MMHSIESILRYLLLQIFIDDVCSIYCSLSSAAPLRSCFEIWPLLPAATIEAQHLTAFADRSGCLSTTSHRIYCCQCADGCSAEDGTSFISYSALDSVSVTPPSPSDTDSELQQSVGFDLLAAVYRDQIYAYYLLQSQYTIYQQIQSVGAISILATRYTVNITANPLSSLIYLSIPEYEFLGSTLSS